MISQVWIGRTLRLLAALLLLAVLAACEDNQSVKEVQVPPGKGTEQSPFLMYVGDEYTEIPISAYGTYYFVLSDTTKNRMHSVNITSDEDLDLRMYDPQTDSFSGITCTPFRPDGNESCWVVGYTTFTNVYFTVTAAHIDGESTSFGVSTLADFTASESIKGGFFIDYYGFGPPGRTVTIRLQADTENFAATLWDSFTPPTQLTFPGNAGIPDECDVNYSGTGADETCPGPALSSDPPFLAEVTNYGATQDFTLTLTAP